MVNEIDDAPVPTFKRATIHEIFRMTWASDRLTSAASLDSQTKINEPALHLSAEYLRLFTVEAIHRAAKAAKEEQQKGTRAAINLIEVKDLQKVAPGLVLDF